LAQFGFVNTLPVDVRRASITALSFLKVDESGRLFGQAVGANVEPHSSLAINWPSPSSTANPRPCC